MRWLARPRLRRRYRPEMPPLGRARAAQRQADGRPAKEGRSTRDARNRAPCSPGERAVSYARPALASVGVWKYSLSEASCSISRLSSAIRPSAVLMGMQS